MSAVEIDSLDDPRLALYRSVTDAALLRDHGLFVAEGRLVVRTLLTTSPLKTRSLLLTANALESLRDILSTRDDLPVFVVPQDIMNAAVGFNIHRGCLAMGERPPERSLDARIGDAPSLLIVLENISNADNVGGIFRCAAAFGASGVLVGPNCCDPLYRKSIRTSMGAALRVPFAPAERWPDALHRLRALGFQVIALTPDDTAEDLDAVADSLARQPKLALLVGAEGAGLTRTALSAADRRVRIRMVPAVDSLNVAVAAGIALHRLAVLPGSPRPT